MPLDEAAHRIALRGIVDPLSVGLTDLSAAVEADNKVGLLQVITAEAPNNLLGISEDSREALKALTPPDRFRGDHDRFVRGLRDLAAILLSARTAAAIALLNIETLLSAYGFPGAEVAEFEAVVAALEALDQWRSTLKVCLSLDFRAVVASFFGDDEPNLFGDRLRFDPHHDGRALPDVFLREAPETKSL